MRILHLIYDHPDNPWLGGGGARRARIMDQELVRRGHAVHLISGAFPGQKQATDLPMTWDFVGSTRGYTLGTFSFAIQAWRRLQRIAGNYDVILEDFAPWNPLFSYRLRHPPAVLQIQNRLGFEIIRRHPLTGWPFLLIERFYPRRFRHRITISEALRRNFNIQAEVISMGIDSHLLTEPTDDGRYIGFLGRLDFHQKGLDLLLEATRDLNLPLRIAGDGPDREQLQRLIAHRPNAEWVGKIEGKEKVAFLKEAKLVVAPSRFEGQNLVVLEAAALGRPLIVSSVPELGYATRHGFALEFPTGSSDRLRIALDRLWNDRSLRAEMAVRGRDYVRPLTWENVTDRMERYLRGVIEKDR